MIWRHKNFFWNKLSRFEIEQNLRKITFMLENIFPGTNLYLPLHLHGFEAKQKIP